MGCDIHVSLERKVSRISGEGFEWRCVTLFEVPPEKALTETKLSGHDYYRVESRNYDFFAALAGVRGNTVDKREPKGLPDDLSLEVAWRCAYWDSDGHSFSWDYADDFCSMFFKHCLNGEEQRELAEEIMTGDEAIESWKKVMNLYLWRVSDDAKSSDYRFVYFFDN